MALRGKSAVFTPLVIPLSKSFYPVMTGLRGTCSFNGEKKKIKLRAFHSFICHPAASYLSLHYLCSLHLPSRVLARLSLSCSSDRRLPGRRENHPPQAVLPARAQPFHTTPLSTADQLQATPAAFSSSKKKKNACHLDHTDHETVAAAAAAAASIRRTSFKCRPSPGDAISVALYIKQASSLILNPIG